MYYFKIRLEIQIIFVIFNSGATTCVQSISKMLRLDIVLMPVDIAQEKWAHVHTSLQWILDSVVFQAKKAISLMWKNISHVRLWVMIHDMRYSVLIAVWASITPGWVLRGQQVVLLECRLEKYCRIGMICVLCVFFFFFNSVWKE